MTTTQILPAEKFFRVVTALSRQFVVGNDVGIEWLFMINPSVDVHAWVPRENHLVLQLIADGETVRTVTVCPGEYKLHEVVVGDHLVIGETHGAEAAFSTALDYLTAPLRGAAQHDHDPCSV